MSAIDASTSAPFSIHASGHAEIAHPAERALINIVVSSSGTNKAAVSDDVITTARHVESLLEPYAPQDDSPEAKESASLAHWSKTGLSATSHIPHHNAGTEAQPPRQYDAEINFDIRFREFKSLGAFGAKLSALPHVEVNNIDWILTSATQKSYHSRLRREAARNALDKAIDYCEVFGCSKPRPVELSESGIMGSGRSRTMQTARKARAAPGTQQLTMMRNTTMASSYSAAAPGEDGHRVEDEFEFEPQEVKMSMNVTVEFHADYIGV